MDEPTSQAAESHGAARGAPDLAQGHPLPAEPLMRSITPAPEDYEVPVPMSRLVWPVVWLGLAAVLVAAVLGLGWHPFVDGGGH